MEFVKLNKLCKMQSGGTPSRANLDFYEGDIPWAKIRDLEKTDDGFISYTAEHISVEALKSINNRFFKVGTLLLAMYGSVGKTAITKIELSTNQAILGINILDEKVLDIKYLRYWFTTIKEKLLDRAVGAALANISLGIVKELEIPLPPLPQQQKIANILDAADALRQKDKALLAKYDELTQALFLDMFGDPISNPKGCKIVELGKICSKITDGVHAKPEYTDEGVPFISVKDITTGVLKFEKCKFISKEAHQKYFKRCNPEYLDILYTKVGATYGRPAIVDVENEFSLYVSVALLKPIKEIINPYFLLEVMANPVIKRQADKAIKGIGVPDLHLNMIKKFLLPLPSMEEQIVFSERVQLIEQQKAIAQMSLEKSEELFNSILQKAFKGELL
ncbi:restriction endonuclease subunit S [Flavobacterium antarcticum]|uniref:restriction endonuclease subunit S n=1 Tax=Flavobacterium antarcticum TaxID=271155 RepID=UPI0003B79AD8|nr:restriction endonuclease subunit S [Flavobacterium antarcticum]